MPYLCARVIGLVSIECAHSISYMQHTVFVNNTTEHMLSTLCILSVTLLFGRVFEVRAQLIKKLACTARCARNSVPLLVFCVHVYGDTVHICALSLRHVVVRIWHDRVRRVHR